jgi:regulator of nucleoside diphosphate kinase
VSYGRGSLASRVSYSKYPSSRIPEAGDAVLKSLLILGAVNSAATSPSCVFAIGRTSVALDRSITISEHDFTRLHPLRGHAQLAAELAKAIVVKPDRVPPDVVTMNSRVRFEDKSTGEIRDVTIVFPKEADASAGKVSVLATAGMALLGVAVGHSITWPFPDGSKHELLVLKLIYQAAPE